MYRSLNICYSEVPSVSPIRPGDIWVNVQSIENIEDKGQILTITFAGGEKQAFIGFDREELLESIEIIKSILQVQVEPSNDLEPDEF